MAKVLIFLLFFLYTLPIIFGKTARTHNPVAYCWLRLQWRQAFCDVTNHCRQPVGCLDDFCITGLSDDFYISGMSPRDEKGLTPCRVHNDKFDPNNVQYKSLEPYMISKWESPLTTITNEAFWKKEWDEHGVYSALDQYTYFKTALDAYYRLANIKDRLNQQLPFTFPDQQMGHTARQIHDAIRTAYGVDAKLLCNHKIMGVRQSLVELHFNMTSNPTTFHTIDINVRDDCEEGLVIIIP